RRLLPPRRRPQGERAELRAGARARRRARGEQRAGGGEGVGSEPRLQPRSTRDRAPRRPGAAGAPLERAGGGGGGADRPDAPPGALGGRRAAASGVASARAEICAKSSSTVGARSGRRGS